MFIEDLTQTFETDRGLKHRFCAIDLAPNDQLETGFAALDRDRTLIRMDKLYRDDEILAAVENLGPANGLIVVIDMPKSLSIPGRWRQEEVKMHPLRLKRADGVMMSRYNERGKTLYDKLAAKGILAFLYFNYWTRMNYEMLLPHRSRSPQGCRALQTALDYQLGIKNLPSNLAPSSVLESIVGAYASWSVWAGEAGRDYEIHRLESGHHALVPLKRPHVNMTERPRYRRYPRRQIRWFKSTRG